MNSNQFIEHYSKRRGMFHVEVRDELVYIDSDSSELTHWKNDIKWI